MIPVGHPKLFGGIYTRLFHRRHAAHHKYDLRRISLPPRELRRHFMAAPLPARPSQTSHHILVQRNPGLFSRHQPVHLPRNSSFTVEAHTKRRQSAALSERSRALSSSEPDVATTRHDEETAARPVRAEDLSPPVKEPGSLSNESAKVPPPKPLRSYRIALCGAGPAGLTALRHMGSKWVAKRLEEGVRLEIDVFEASLLPLGLVRLGVAPDHASTKAVGEGLLRSARRLQQEGGDDFRFRYFGGVEVGRWLTLTALRNSYDSVIMTTGLPKFDDVPNQKASLNIPNEFAPGVVTSRECVEFYNGRSPTAPAILYDLYKTVPSELLTNGRWTIRPGFSNQSLYRARYLDRADERDINFRCGRFFDDTNPANRIVVIGQGNVSVDIIRVFLTDPNEFPAHYVSDKAKLLHASSFTRPAASPGLYYGAPRKYVNEYIVFGRRGALQSAWDTATLRELFTLPDVQILVRPDELWDSICHPVVARDLERNRTSQRMLSLLEQGVSNYQGWRERQGKEQLLGQKQLEAAEQSSAHTEVAGLRKTSTQSVRKGETRVEASVASNDRQLSRPDWRQSPGGEGNLEDLSVRIWLRFLRTPIEIGTDASGIATSITTVRNELYQPSLADRAMDMQARPRSNPDEETVEDCRLIIKSLGFGGQDSSSPWKYFDPSPVKHTKTVTSKTTLPTAYRGSLKETVVDKSILHNNQVWQREPGKAPVYCAGWFKSGGSGCLAETIADAVKVSEEAIREVLASAVPKPLHNEADRLTATLTVPDIGLPASWDEAIALLEDEVKAGHKLTSWEEAAEKLNDHRHKALARKHGVGGEYVTEDDEQEKP